MIFFWLLVLVATTSFASELTPKVKKHLNSNPHRDTSAHEGVAKPASLIDEPQDSRPKSVESKLKQNEQQIPTETVPKMSCSRAIYNFDSGHSAIVPLFVEQGPFTELVDSFILPGIFFASPDAEIFIHYDDADLEWRSRAREGILNYTAVCSVDDLVSSNLNSLMRLIYSDPLFVAKFDGISVKMRNDEAFEVSVLTRFTEDEPSAMHLLVQARKLAFAADTRFEVAKSRNKIIGELQFLHLKRHTKRNPWIKDDRFLKVMPLMGHQTALTLAKAAKARQSEAKPAKSTAATTKPSQSAQPSRASDIRNPVAKAAADSSFLVPDIDIPIKMTQSPPRLAPSQKQHRHAIEEVRRKFSLDFDSIPNVYRKEPLPPGTQMRRRIVASAPASASENDYIKGIDSRMLSATVDELKVSNERALNFIHSTANKLDSSSSSSSSSTSSRKLNSSTPLSIQTEEATAIIPRRKQVSTVPKKSPSGVNEIKT
jgi:hypothetical protein